MDTNLFAQLTGQEMPLPYPEDKQAIRVHPADARSLAIQLNNLHHDLPIQPRYPLIFVDPKQKRGLVELASEKRARELDWDKI